MEQRTKETELFEPFWMPFECEASFIYFCIFWKNCDQTEAVQQMAFSWTFWTSSFAFCTSSFASFTSSFAFSTFSSAFCTFSSASLIFRSSPVCLAVCKSSTAMSTCTCAAACWSKASSSWRRAKVKASACHDGQTARMRTKRQDCSGGLNVLLLSSLSLEDKKDLPLMSPVFLKANYSVFLFRFFLFSFFLFPSLSVWRNKTAGRWMTCPEQTCHMQHDMSICNMQEPLNRSEVKSKQQINVKLPLKRGNSMADNGRMVPHLSQAIVPARVAEADSSEKKIALWFYELHSLPTKDQRMKSKFFVSDWRKVKNQAVQIAGKSWVHLKSRNIFVDFLVIAACLWNVHMNKGAICKSPRSNALETTQIPRAHLLDWLNFFWTFLQVCQNQMH